MISVEHVSKRYQTRQGWRTVLDDINFTLQKGEKIGILGRNGAGKSTLIRLMSGVESPSSGEIRRTMSISWPLAFSGAFQGGLTGMDNLRFICRIYNVDIGYAKAFTEEFSELGEYLYEPVKRYSSGMKARLAFALSLAVEFDCYLIDEVIAVGDSRFSEKCRYELFEKRQDRSIILVSHSPSAIRRYCDNAAVLEDGVMYNFDSIDEAYGFYNRNEIVVPLEEDVDLHERLSGSHFIFSWYDGRNAREILLREDGIIETIGGKGSVNEYMWNVEQHALVFKNQDGRTTSTYFHLTDKSPTGIEALGYYERNRTIIFKLNEIIS